jgi:hypothetical protein
VLCSVHIVTISGKSKEVAVVVVVQVIGILIRILKVIGTALAEPEQVIRSGTAKTQKMVVAHHSVDPIEIRPVTTHIRLESLQQLRGSD